MDYRIISLDGWVNTGAGGNGKTYANESFPGKLLKINNGKLSRLDFVKAEFDRNKDVFDLGIRTPDVYEIIKVGNSYGTISQKIEGKKSFSRVCADEPSRIPEMASLLATKGKELHTTPCDLAKFPSRKQQAIKGAKIFPLLKSSEREKLLAFIDTIPESANCLHGDFQFGNILLASGQCWWIDLGRFAHGDPMFDIGHFLLLINDSRLKMIQNITHLTQEQSWEFWNCFVREYAGITDKEGVEEFNVKANKYMVLDTLTRYTYQPSKLLALLQLVSIRKIISEYF